jgi:hypothetical protein
MSASNNSAFNLRSVLEKEKLNGTNFIDWYHNLRIVLRQEKKEYVLEQPYPDDFPDDATAAARRTYEKHCNEPMTHSMSDVSCLPPCPLICRRSISILMLTP